MKLRTLALSMMFVAAAFGVGTKVELAHADDKAPAVAPGGPLTAEQLVDRVQGFYNKTKTFKAGFKQQYVIRAYNTTKKSEGEVTFAKPGKMSWRFTNNGNRVVSDGKIVKVYEKDNKQMFEQPLDKSQYPAALSFLVGGGSLKKEFKLKVLDPAEAQFEGGAVLLGIPKAPSPAYQKMLLYVDLATYQVRRVLFLDAQGNKNRFDFLKPEVNFKPSPTEFTFTPPAGTQIIRP
jgi:outer membrane lipoprotein carrier protein